MGHPDCTVEVALSFLIDRNSVKEPIEWGMAGGLSAHQEISHPRERTSAHLRNMAGWGGGSCQNGRYQRAQITRVQFWLWGTPEDNYVFPLKFMLAAQKPLNCPACLRMQRSLQ